MFAQTNARLFLSSPLFFPTMRLLTEEVRKPSRRSSSCASKALFREESAERQRESERLLNDAMPPPPAARFPANECFIPLSHVSLSLPLFFFQSIRALHETGDQGRLREAAQVHRQEHPQARRGPLEQQRRRRWRRRRRLDLLFNKRGERLCVPPAPQPRLLRPRLADAARDERVAGQAGPPGHGRRAAHAQRQVQADRRRARPPLAAREIQGTRRRKSFFFSLALFLILSRVRALARAVWCCFLA